MNRNQISDKKMLDVDENKEVFDVKKIPTLKLCNSPRLAESPLGVSSLSYRLKKRNQVNRSLDFNLTARLILTPKVIKADHNIVSVTTPRANTYRQINFGSTVTLKNRMISKNLLLDSCRYK